MRVSVIFIACIFNIYCSSAQTEEIYSVKAGDIMPAKAIYVLPAFTEGTVFLRNGSSPKQRLNFNCLTGEMQFINRKGDTLAIAEPGLIKSIFIDTMVFYYDKNYLQQVFKADSFRLAVQTVLVQLPDKVAGGYGTANENVSVTKYGGINSIDGMHDLRADKDLAFKKVRTYYIGDGYNLFLKADKKAFTSFFSRKKSQVEEYLRENKINFTKEEDLEKLLMFCVQ